MALLSTSILIGSFNSTLTPFHPVATEVVKNNDNLNEMVFIKHPIQVQFENKKLENEKKAEEERLRKEKELEEQKKNEPILQDFVLTYYGLLESECGKTDGITASGKKISRGMIASPSQLKFGTKIIIEGNEYVVEDRGSSKYIKVNNDGSIRLDVYLERLANESDREYYNRIQSKGVRKVKGYILK